jgi:predicted DCC family thiol-disulfide oxidoreductase YuxK
MGSSTPIEEGRPVILFDGVCNLCNGAVKFILKRDPAGKFLFASLQSPFAAQAVKDFAIESTGLYSILLIKNGRLFDRSDALLEITRDLSAWWPALYMLRVVPKVIRDGVYKFVANNRYRLFGKDESCLLPTTELRSRFLN